MLKIMLAYCINAYHEEASDPVESDGTVCKCPAAIVHFAETGVAIAWVLVSGCRPYLVLHPRPGMST